MTLRAAAVFGVIVAITASSPFAGGCFAASWGLWNDPHGDIVIPAPRPAPETLPVVPQKAEVTPVPSALPEQTSNAAAPEGSSQAAPAVSEASIQLSTEGAVLSGNAIGTPAVVDAAVTAPAGNVPATPAITFAEPAGKEAATAVTADSVKNEARQAAEAILPMEAKAEVNKVSTEGANQLPADNETVTAIAAVQPTGELVSAIPQQAGDAYVIGSGDVLDIAVWRDESLTRTVVVLPDGTISFPLIGVVKAAGRTVEQLKEEIGTRLSNYVSDLTLSLEVRQASSMMIFVVGKVNSPGRHPISSPVNVLQALAMAGGVNPFAKKDDIKIFRQEDGKTVIFPFAYNEVSRGNRLEENIVLRRGDLIVVP